MSDPHDNAPLDRLWKEYAETFQSFDDLTLARWCSQTLGQLRGSSWRLSHPLVGAYRLSSQVAHNRQIWLKRLVNLPGGYTEAPCCRAPLLPLFTRDVVTQGLTCQHCGEACVAFEDLPEPLRNQITHWSVRYDPIHQVAHWDDAKRTKLDYDDAYEDAAQEGERLLHEAAAHLMPALLELYPAVLWEDQDECLEIRPEDLTLGPNSLPKPF